MLSEPTVSGVAPVWMQRTKSRITPPWPPILAGSSKAGSSRSCIFDMKPPVSATTWAWKPVAPSHFTLPFVPTIRQSHSHVVLQPLGAPTAAVGVDDAVGHLEDRHGRGVVIVPGAGRVPLVAVDRGRVGAGDQPRCVEGVDRHVEQQHVLHAVAEAAEVRADVEVAVDGRDLADGARLEEGASRRMFGS